MSLPTPWWLNHIAIALAVMATTAGALALLGIEGAVTAGAAAGAWLYIGREEAQWRAVKYKRGYLDLPGVIAPVAAVTLVWLAWRLLT